MLVITAIVAGSFTIVPSDSSASATIQSPLPCRALEPHALMIPPLTTVGSRPAASSTCAISEVVVGFAMRAANGDRPLQAHQLAQHLGATDDRNEELAGGYHLRVVGFHRRGDHHHRGRPQVGLAMADRDRNTLRGEAPRIGALGTIAALDLDSRGCASARRYRSCQSRRCRRSGWRRYPEEYSSRRKPPARNGDVGRLRPHLQNQISETRRGAVEASLSRSAPPPPGSPDA